MKNGISNKNELEDANNYVVFKDSIILFHSLFAFIYSKFKEGIDIREIQELPADSFPGKIKPDKSNIEHIYSKCKYFDHHSQRKIPANERFVFLNAKDIESKLANLNQVTFEITDACNLKCKYCGYGDFYDDFDERKSTVMDINSAKTILDYLITLWNSNLNISHNRNIYISFYGGEPLLNMDFIKGIIDFVNNTPLIHNYITYSMTTNALLLKKNIDYLIKNNVKLLISLDGDIDHNSYRVFHNGAGSFNTVYKNIKYVQEKYPEYFGKMVNFNSVLHNKNSVSGIYYFIKNEFGKLPFISELNNMGIKPDKRNEFYHMYQNTNESLMQAEDYTYIKKDMFYKVGETTEVGLFLHQYSGNIFDDYNDLFKDKDVIMRTPTGTCFPFGKKMFITVNGKILPCERIGHKYALGKVTPGNVELDFEEIAAKYNHYYAKSINQCNHCFNVETCMQCMFNLNDLDGKPVCKGFINGQQFNRKVNREMSFLEDEPTLYNKIIEDLIIEM